MNTSLLLERVMYQLKRYEGLFDEHNTDRNICLCDCDFCLLYADLNDDEEGEP